MCTRLEAPLALELCEEILSKRQKNTRPRLKPYGRADSNGVVCSPLQLHPVTGCCTGAGNEGDSAGDACTACSDRKCCESFAKCVACCSRVIPRGREAAQISPMHPAMWRKWLIQHDSAKDGRLDVRGESFDDNGQRELYRVPAFDYCTHKCRSNSGSTKFENTFQHQKHHCFGTDYAEVLGPDNTQSPGRNAIRSQNSDFKLQNGQGIDVMVKEKLDYRRRSGGGQVRCWVPGPLPSAHKKSPSRQAISGHSR